MALQPYKAYLLSQLLPAADAICMQMQRNLLQLISNDYRIPIGELYGKYMDEAPPMVEDGSTQTETETPVTKKTHVMETQTTNTTTFTMTTQTPTPKSDVISTQTETETQEFEVQCDITTYPFSMEVPRTTPHPVDIQPQTEIVEEPENVEEVPPSPVRSAPSSEGERRKPGRPRTSDTNKSQKIKKTKPCAGFTAKGDPCRFCIPDSDTYCGQHIKNPGKSKAQMEQEQANKKSKRKGKQPKVQPVHNHGPGEVPPTPCMTCEIAGDIVDPAAPSTSSGYTVKTKKEAKKILAETLVKDTYNTIGLGDSSDEEEEEDEKFIDDEFAVKDPNWMKILIAKRFEEDEEDVDLEQMTETPTSRQTLKELFADGVINNDNSEFGHLMDSDTESDEEN